MIGTHQKLWTMLAISFTVACAGNPGPGEPGYAYNVTGEYGAEVAANDGVTYTGSVNLETSAGGTVSGDMQISDPTNVNGTLQGTLTEDQLTLSIDFEIPDIGCAGVVSGTLSVEEGGGSAEGEVEIQADCDSPTSATLRLQR